MVKLSAVQGRFSSEVAGKYQYFPIHNWRNEFKEASEIGFDGIEWIISDFSNPMFDPIAQLEIIALCKNWGVEITSINLDLLMYKTLNNFSKIEIKWIFDNINFMAKKIGLLRVSIPIEETCGIRDNKTFLDIQNSLSEIKNLSTKAYLLAIETDMTPQSTNVFLNHNKLQDIGVLVDIGNASAYGYSLKDYFDILSKKIYSLHIKDRAIGIGSTVPLGQGTAEFKFLKKNISKLINLKDIVLQTYKTNKNYLKDIKKSKHYVLNNVINKT